MFPNQKQPIIRTCRRCKQPFEMRSGMQKYCGSRPQKTGCAYKIKLKQNMVRSNIILSKRKDGKNKKICASNRIQVRCGNCDELYEIPHSKSPRIQNKILDISICSHCNVPRNITKIVDYFKSKCCKRCGIPIDLLNLLLTDGSCRFCKK